MRTFPAPHTTLPHAVPTLTHHLRLRLLPHVTTFRYRWIPIVRYHRVRVTFPCTHLDVPTRMVTTVVFALVTAFTFTRSHILPLPDLRLRLPVLRLRDLPVYIPTVVYTTIFTAGYSHYVTVLTYCLCSL